MDLALICDGLAQSRKEGLLQTANVPLSDVLAEDPGLGEGEFLVGKNTVGVQLAKLDQLLGERGAR